MCVCVYNLYLERAFGFDCVGGALQQMYMGALMPAAATLVWPDCGDPGRCCPGLVVVEEFTRVKKKYYSSL